MNYGQFGFEYGGTGRFPAQQDGFTGQVTTPRVDPHPTLTQMADWPFHSTPHNLSNARLIWRADSSQSPIPPPPALLPILPAHRMLSTPGSNTALDLTVCRQLSVPTCLEEPIDMTLSSKVVSDQGDAPLALTNKVSQDQATVTADTPQTHPKTLNRKSPKSKKSPNSDASSVSGFRKPSKASEPVSAAFDVSPRRVTRQSVRSGQAALSVSGAPYLSPASTMEAVEGLLMLPQLSSSDASPTEFSPTAMRPLKIPRKALRPMRLQAEHAARNSAIFSTPSVSSCRPSAITYDDNFTHSANAASSSKVQLATKNTSDDNRSTGDLQESNSVGLALLVPAVASLPVTSCVSTAAVETSATDSVVTQLVDSVTTVIEATTQNSKPSRAKTNNREQSCTVTRESSCQIEDRQESAVSKSSLATDGLSGSVAEIDFMHSYAGSKISDAGSLPSETGSLLSDTGAIPSETGSMPYYAGSMHTNTLCLPSETGSVLSDASSVPSDMGSMPYYAGSMPSDTLCMPSNAGSMSPDTGSMHTDTVCIPSDIGCITSAAGSLPDTDAMQTDTICIPTDIVCVASATDSMPDTGTKPSDTASTSDAGSMLSDVGAMPSDAGSMPKDDGSVADIDTGSMGNDAGSLPMDTLDMPSDAGSISPDTDSIPTDTVCRPSDTGSTPGAGSMLSDVCALTSDAGSMPDTDTGDADAGSMSPDTESIPTDTGCRPSDAGSKPNAGSMLSDVCAMPSETGSMPSDAGSMAETSADLDRQIASLASLDLNQTKQLILSLYRHLETLERTQLAADITDHSANNSQAAESHDIERCQHNTSHDLPVTQASSSHSDSHDLPMTQASSSHSDSRDLPVTQASSSHSVSHDLPVTQASSSHSEQASSSHLVSHDLPVTQASSSHSEQASSSHSDSHDLPVTKASSSHSDSHDPKNELASRTNEDLNAACVNSDTAETNDDNTEREKSDVPIVELNIAASLTDSEDNSQSADEAVSSGGAEASNANHVDEGLPPGDDQVPYGVPPIEPMVTASSEVLPPGDDQLPVQDPYGVPPIEPMVTASGEALPPENDQLPVQIPYRVPPFEPRVTASNEALPPENDQLPVQVPYGVPPIEPMVTASSEVLPPGDDQLPVQDPYGVPPFEPMVTSSDGGLVEIPPGYFAVPFSTVGDFFPHHEQPVIIFVDSHQYLETTALASQHLGPLGSHALSTQTVDEVQPHLLPSQQISPMEPHLLTSQQVSLVECHSHTSQQVTPVQPHLITSQNVSLLESCACTSQQVLPLEQHSITTQQVSLVPDEPHSHLVSILEAITLTSHQVTSVQPHLHVLTREHVSIMEPHSIASHQIVPLEPTNVTNQQVSMLESHALSNHNVVPVELTIITSQQGSLLEPQSMTSQSVSSLECTALTNEQDIPLSGVAPLMAEESSGWGVRSSYQSSLQLEAISPPSSVLSMNDVEDAEENSSAGFFDITEELERNSCCPSMEVDSVSGKEEWFETNDVEVAEENSNADVSDNTEELERNSSHPFVEVGSECENEEQLQLESDEASGGLESDSLAHEVERNTSPVVSTPLEDVVDTVELGSELQYEVVEFRADDLTEVVANEEVETVDLHDDEESQESLSLRLSVSSEEDLTDLVEKPSDSFTKRNQFGGHELEADGSHFEPFYSSFTRPNKTTVESDSQESSDTSGHETETITRAFVSDEEMTENDDCFLSDSLETPKFQIQDTHPDQTSQNRAKDIARIRSSNDNLIELCAEQLGTSVRVNPNLLPKDITSLFNCSVVIKMLKLSQPPSREIMKKEKSTTTNKKQRRMRSKGVVYINDDEIEKTFGTSEEASNISQAKRTIEQISGKTGKGFKRRSCISSAGEAAVEAGIAEIQQMNVAQTSDKADSITEPVGTTKISDAVKTVDNDNAFEPMSVLSAVHLNQEDDHGEQHDDLADDLKSKDDHVIVVQKPSEVNVNYTNNSQIEPNEETDILADSFVLISLDRKTAAEPVNTPVGAGTIIDSVYTQDAGVMTSSISQLSSNIDAHEEKSNSRAESDDRKVSKKICKIRLSGLSKPPKLNRLSPYSTPTASHKSLGDLDLPSTSTSPSVFKGVSTNRQENWTPILDVNSCRETTGEISSIIEPQVTARDRKEERNIFRIQIPLVVGSRQKTAAAEPDQTETPESVSHEISKTVLTLRTIFQGVAQMAENRERFISTTSERNPSEERRLHKPGEMVLGCVETSAGGDSYHLNDRESVADANLEGSDVGTEQPWSHAEGMPVSESVTPVEAGEMVQSSGTFNSSETLASSSETPSSAGEMLVCSGATLCSGETVASLSETLASLSEALYSSCETPFTWDETADNSGKMIASSGETMVTSKERIITFKEPVTGLGETVERNNDTDDDDDDNENIFFEPNEYPMEQDDTSEATFDMTFDSTEKQIGLSSWEEKSPDGQRKRKSTDPNAVYAVQTRDTKRPRLTELNCGQPCAFSWENETDVSGTDQNQPTVVVLQISNDGHKSCEDLINSCRNIVPQAGESDKPLPSDLLRHGQSENPLDDRFVKSGKDEVTESGLHHPDLQLGNCFSTDPQPEPHCLWEFLETAETGIESSPRNQSSHYENSYNHNPESLPKSVNTPPPPVSRRPKDSTSQQSGGDSDDLELTSSEIRLLDSLNSTTDVVVRKLPINCPLIKCTAVSVLSRAVSSSAPGVKHLQCLFCHTLASTMKGITAHLEQCHADIVNFAISKVNPSKDFSICYFCRHCQFVTTDHVVIWIHFQTTHNIFGILESCNDVTVAEDSDGCSTKLDLSLDSPVHWYRVFMCPECNGLTDDEATMALHMTTTHPRSPHSNGHFVKVIALLRPRNHLKQLTYRMLLMDDVYKMNRKNCFICSFCYFVIFDPRLALSHFLSLHSDMKLLFICKSDSCDERFVREKAFVEHYKQRHRPKTVPMNFNCSVTLVTKSSAERGVTEVMFVDDD